MIESPQRVLITGAAGFIGSHLTDRLLERGLEVIGIDDLSSGSRANLASALRKPRFRFVEGDLLDPGAIRQVLGKCASVFHLAADPEVRVGVENPDSHYRQNLQATYNLLEAIRKRNTPTRLVFTSTCPCNSLQVHQSMEPAHSVTKTYTGAFSGNS